MLQYIMAGKYRGRKPVGRRPPAKRRKFVKKKKPRFVPKKPIAMGVECYQFRLSTQSTTLSANTGSVVNGPANSEICLPAGFSANTVCTDSNGTLYNISGSWLKPVYNYTTKVKVDFSGIVKHADNVSGLNLRCHHGLIKMTAVKAIEGSGWGSQANFQTEVLKLIKENLYESNISADYLDYSQKNRNVKVIKSFDVVPDRRRMIRMDMLEDSSTGSLTSVNTPPPKCFTIHHPCPRMKTRVAKTSDSAAFPVLENLWIPWVMLTCSQLTTNSGHFNVDYSSRMYFTDV